MPINVKFGKTLGTEICFPKFAKVQLVKNILIYLFLRSHTAKLTQGFKF